MTGVRRVFESNLTAVRLLDKSTPVVEIEGRSAFAAPRTTFAILDVAFGPRSVCISEAGGPTRLFDLVNGEELWTYRPPPSEHLLSLAYAGGASTFVGVSREYERTAVTFLVRFGMEGGVERLADLTQVAEARFCLSGEALALSDGRLLRSSSGELIRAIQFEECAG